MENTQQIQQQRTESNSSMTKITNCSEPMKILLNKVLNKQDLSVDHISKEIIKAKWEGVRFLEMSEKQIFIAIEMFLGSISMITGWNLPQIKKDNTYTPQGKMMINELCIALKTHYENLNYQELALAFRTHSQKIKEYGKDFNINFLHEIMNHYNAERQEAMEIERKIVENAKEEKKLTEAQQQNIIRESIESDYQSYISGTYNELRSKVGYIGYDQLVKDDFFENKESYTNLMSKALIELKIEFKSLLDSANKSESIELKNKLSILKKIEDIAKNKAYVLALEYFKTKNVACIYKCE